MKPGYELSECDQCGGPCEIPITSMSLGRCQTCKIGLSPREQYEAVWERIMEPLPQREALEMPNPDTWIHGEP